MPVFHTTMFEEFFSCDCGSTSSSDPTGLGREAGLSFVPNLTKLAMGVKKEQTVAPLQTGSNCIVLAETHALRFYQSIIAKVNRFYNHN